MAGGSTACVLLGLAVLAASVWQASAREIELVETGRILDNNEVLSFGTVSDIIVDLQCVGDGDANSDWFRRFPFILQLAKPLDPTETSYDLSSGFLRLLSPFLQDQDNIDLGLITIQCVRDSRPASVDFRPEPSLFFNGALPTTLASKQALSLRCADLLPDLPTSSVTVQSVSGGGDTSSHSYCEVDSARGSFRSRSVVVGEGTTEPPKDPIFYVQPLNITVQPINAVTRGAFSCAVFPSNNVQSINWFFEPAGSGSAQGSVGMPIEPMQISPDSNTMMGYSGGTSVLVLDSVGMEQEGAYHCVAVMITGSSVDSEVAHLTFSGTASNVDRIILPPPPSLVAYEGDTLLIPCVGSTNPIFPDSEGISSLFGLTITAQRQDNGFVSCEVGMATENVEISVLGPIQFETELDPEVVRFLNADSSPSILLPCEVSGNPLPTVSFLKNGNLISMSDNQISVIEGTSTCSVCVHRILSISAPMRGDEGVYQCVGQQGGDGSTAITSSSYVNIQFLGNPIISDPTQPIILRQATTPSALVLNCSVEAHPIPSLSWSRDDGISARGKQGITGFGEVAFSLLSVTVEDLAGRVQFSCTAVLMGEAEVDTVLVTAYSLVVIVEQPVAPDRPLVVGETATLTCVASSIPSPVITWFRVQNGAGPVELVNGGDVMIMIVNDTTVRSTLQLVLANEADFAGYFCRGDNGFVSEDSNTVQITLAVESTILQSPKDALAVEAEVVEFNCTASGIPSPTITWMISPPSGGIPAFNATTMPVTGSETRVVGLLLLEVTPVLNLTTVRCVAANGEGEAATSSSATLTVAGIPTVPVPAAVNLAARSVTIQWAESFSLIPITPYSVRTTLGGATVSDNTTPNLTIALTGLRPFSDYNVIVTATNRAGSVSGFVEFTTLEDAPDAPPSNVVVEAVDAYSIRLSWDPPPVEQRNGIITRYLIQYSLAHNSSVKGSALSSPATETSPATESLVIPGLSPDTAYSFSVAALTSSPGQGPFSLGIIQRTYPQLPSPPENPPNISSGADITLTTIPIILPKVNTSQYSHFWVIALKLGDSQASFLDGNPTDQFSDNSTFQNYSTGADLLNDTPYVVSEMSASSYEAVSSSGGMLFVLGDDNSTKSRNDFTDRYQNGPLQEGTPYSVFVWAFVQAIPLASGNDDAVSKRQSDDGTPRQYTVYSSSDFLPSTFTGRTSTGGGGGLTGGQVGGIVVAILLSFILVPIVVVMVMLFSRIWYRKVKDLGPPPTRHGSQRFKENKSVEIISNPATRPDSELQEMTPDDVRLPVSVKDFPTQVKKLHANSDHPFSEEYQMITIKSPGLPHLQGSIACNVMKNRYANINAFDESRVHLNFVPGVEGSDFINANYIDGYQKRAVNIAAQGPLPNTVHDFWRMVWEENSCCIIMLTNLNEKGRVKCHQYWPETGSLGLGDITVSVIDTQELAYYTIRTFKVNRGTERREVKQFHYTGWPDFGVPDHPHPVIAFIHRLNNFKRTTRGPDIVHCSAGVGRTGTLITIQAMMHMIEDEGQVDIFNFILGMRRQRSYMVQTERQYIFIHDAVLELIRIGNTEVPIQDLRRTYSKLQAQNPQSETSALEDDYLKLNRLPKVDDVMFSYANHTLNTPKNRNSDILPLDMYRVRLIMAPGFSCSDYINASYVDGYQRRHQYILTQAPMKSTVDDFWRMMWEHRVSCVMMICQEEEKGEEMCVRYWPTDRLRQHGDLFVELTSESTYPSYIMREFSVTNTKINESRVLKHYQYTDWLEEAVPPNSAAIIDLIGVLQKAQHQNGGGPIALHDSTPIGRAGTFCVLSSVLEQLKVEGVVDLFFFIHALRQQQPGVVATYEQYKFCFTSVLEFLDSFDHYSNFD